METQSVIKVSGVFFLPFLLFGAYNRKFRDMRESPDISLIL